MHSTGQKNASYFHTALQIKHILCDWSQVEYNQASSIQGQNTLRMHFYILFL